MDTGLNIHNSKLKVYTPALCYSKELWIAQVQIWAQNFESGFTFDM
jgi:hypothetical protein